MDFRYSIKPWLFRSFVGRVARREPRRLVVLSDSTDVIAGGCSDEELVRGYNATVAAAGGAPAVVASGEFFCFPRSPHCAAYRRLRARRLRALRGQALSEDVYSGHTTCREVRRQRGNHTAQCSRPPAYEYLNSGLIMGPARELHDVLVAWQAEHTEADDELGGDQFSLARVMLARPDLLGIDYGGRLVVTVAGWTPRAVGSSLVARDGLVWNRVTGRVQCFVHGAGPGRDVMWQLLMDLGLVD